MSVERGVGAGWAPPYGGMAGARAPRFRRYPLARRLREPDLELLTTLYLRLHRNELRLRSIAYRHRELV